MRLNKFVILAIFFFIESCVPHENSSNQQSDIVVSTDSLAQIEQEKEPKKRIIIAANIIISKDLTYDKYTLEDTYPYKDTVREFQWDKIKEMLAKIENVQQDGAQPWGILQNRKNKNGEAPLVGNWSRNEYKNVADSLGVERFQGIPLYILQDSLISIRYGMDGELVRLNHNTDSTEFVALQTVYIPGDFMTPRKYVHIIDTIVFNKVAVVDRKNQNITTLEKNGDQWLVRSMNPATTGQHRPPYAHDTPLGIFVIQEKKEKMYYLVDGTSTLAGYAPWASRFSNGGYIHGVPTNNPKGRIIEYSQTLGTIPRSHMCVRNASSHAQFVYDWAAVAEGLVIVIQ
jgi:Uncharacterized protein conserved in bacteria